MDAKIVTIDGPAAAGKSTVARGVSRRLGFCYVDSGALYRIVTWQALERGTPTDDPASLGRLVETLKLDFRPCDGAVNTTVDGVAPGTEIRTPEVNAHVSPVSREPVVRERVTAWLRGLRALGNLVVEGRDIGTVVFPESPARFYLDAAPEARARRRQAEEQARGLNQAGDAVLKSLLNRDRIDSTRKAAPLRIPEGAVVIDTTPLTVEQVIDAVLAHLPADYAPAR